MPDTLTSSNGVEINPDVERLAETLEQVVDKEIAEMRERANRMEARLHTFPAAVKRLTRAQAAAVGVYF